MKRLNAILATLFAAFALVAPAQVAVNSQLLYTWPATTSSTTTGQLGSYLVFNGLTTPRPGNFTIDWTDTGTPSACTFDVEGSSDNVHWYALDTPSPSCTSSNKEFVTGEPVLYLRIDLVTFTPGSATVTFHYTGGRS